MKNPFPQLIGAVLVLGAASGASAMTYVLPDDPHLLAAADGVLVGTVVDAARAAKARGLPQVEHRVVIERVLAGRLAHAEVGLQLPGTPPGAALRAHIPGIPTLAPGQRVLVFFDRREAGTIVPAELSLGLFLETRDAAGRGVYRRQLDGGEALNKAEADVRARPRDAAAFERWIRRAAAGSVAAPDYYLAQDAKYVLAPTGFPDGLPARWFQFDTNQAVSVRAVAAGMNGASFDEFAAVSNAIAAWSNDPGSRILLNYGGTVASDNGNNAIDGVNAVIWNDPGNDISGSFNCSGGGVLAIGGSFSSASTGAVAGRTFHRMVESFVITQDNAACVFNGHGGLDGAEILAHEIGHTLGFGHSCEGGGCSPGSAVNDALMRASVHADGRGASLRADDRAAAAVAYPGGTVTPPTSLFRSGFEG
jgi:hypothetical protein